MLLLPLAALATVLAVGPAAHAADLVSLSVSADQAGQQAYLVASLSGADCKGARVTLGFQGGQSQRVTATADGGGNCSAQAAVTVPNPTQCHNGSGPVVAYARLGSGAEKQVTQTVTCAKPPSPKPTKTPSKTPKPSPTSASPTPTPTPSKTASRTQSPSHSPSHSPTLTASPSTVSASPTPSSSDVAALTPLLPLDDGGPQLPGGGGLGGPMSLTALALLAAGAAGGLLLWQRGAGLVPVVAILGGAAVLAAGAMVVPRALGENDTTSHQLTTSTVTAAVTIHAGASSNATASCPSGAAVVGGGAQTTGSADVELSTSKPTGNGWTATVTAPADHDLTLTAVAVCASSSTSTAVQRSDGPYSVPTAQAQRLQARCVDGQPLSVGWGMPSGGPVAAVPLANAASITAWAVPPDVFATAFTLCSRDAQPRVQRVTGRVVELAPGESGRAVAACPAGSQVVGGGFLPTSRADGRVATVSVRSAVPAEGAFQVTARAAPGNQAATDLVAYALCASS